MIIVTLKVNEASKAVVGAYRGGGGGGMPGGGGRGGGKELLRTPLAEGYDGLMYWLTPRPLGLLIIWPDTSTR
jgi:hypothetical protein